MNKIKFICIGVAKCGTSTLDSILRQYSNIELPIIKEPHFFQWKDKYKKPYNILLKRYFTENDNVTRGIIDPTFVYNPIEDIYKYFGRNIKIILMIRNPVNALYSYFKMGLLMGYYSDAYKIKEQKKDGYTTEKLFRNYLIKEKRYRNINIFNYSQYLKNLGFGITSKGNDNVKIIIFERFIKNPEKYTKEILDFVGVDDLGKKQFDVWSNAGNRIAKNYIFCKLNAFLNKLNRYTRDYPITNKRINKVLTQSYKITTKEDNSKMDNRIRKRLEMYFCKEKKLIEKLIGENLENDWF